ncbi:hypothetical protein [Ensifer aridi]|uniref:hypothetical protein n=1 Tax=Ensifer aridi TaxID=1708715 RepID=UPI000A117181|nr:hypothetical protein [Ensifer aridi]
MISRVLCSALTAMAPNRSEESWLAGSSVIAHLLKRTPNDIDIHHLRQGAFEHAIGQDTNVLTRLGFVAIESKVSSGELERTFAHAQGTVKINWVLESERPMPLISDPTLGVRANYTAIVARKLEMYKHDRLAKHREDLLCLLRKEPCVETELDIACFKSQLAALELRTPTKTRSSCTWPQGDLK